MTSGDAPELARELLCILIRDKDQTRPSVPQATVYKLQLWKCSITPNTWGPPSPRPTLRAVATAKQQVSRYPGPVAAVMCWSKLDPDA